MIQVNVKLYGVLRRRQPEPVSGPPQQPFIMPLPDGTSAGDLIAALNIERGLVAGLAVNAYERNEIVRAEQLEPIYLRNQVAQRKSVS